MPMLSVPFLNRHWTEYQEWHDDAELSRRAPYPDDAWFEYASANVPERSLVAFEETGTGRFLSLAQYEIDDGEVSLFLAVNPEYRRQGIGTKTLKSVISASPLSLTRIVARVEADNAPSIAMLRRTGFRPQRPIADEDGMLIYRLDLVES